MRVSKVLTGLVVGVVATQALDVLSEVIYRKESRLLRFRENKTRGFAHAYERAVDKMARAAGIRLSRKEMQRYGWLFHKAFGTLGGLGYATLRKRYPQLSKGFGLLFGTAFFAIGDELLMPLLGLTPGPQKFSWKVHARGAASHIAYGVAAELAALAMESGTKRLAQAATAPA